MNRSSETQTVADRRLERAILLALLGEEARDGCAPEQLAAALSADADALARALARLCHAGVVRAEDARLWASEAARHIDELGLIAV